MGSGHSRRFKLFFRTYEGQVMKIAVCLSGQPRHFEIGYNHLSECLSGHDVDYFFHLWFDESSVGEELKIYSDKNPRASDIVQEDTDKKILELYQPRRYLFEKQIQFNRIEELENNHGRSPKTTSPSDIFESMLYSRWKAGELMAEFIDEYDLAIWTRTDIAPTAKFIEQIDDDSIYSGYCRGPEWHRDHITTGIIASKPAHIKHYLDLYLHYIDIFNEDIDLCDHRMSFYHLKKLNKQFKFILKNNWHWVRQEGLVPGWY